MRCEKIFKFFFNRRSMFSYFFWIVSLYPQDHQICQEQNLHFHELEIECSTCDFIRISLDYKDSQIDFSYNQFIDVNKNIIPLKETYFNRLFNIFDNRAPPSIV